MTHREQQNYDSISSELTKAGIPFEDTTWGNDVTSSISVLCETGSGLHFDEEFQIYIPNSDIQDPENECFNTFAVTAIEQGQTVEFLEVKEVVEFIKIVIYANT